MNLIGDVKGKVAVMVDDMIDTAGELDYIFQILMASHNWKFLKEIFRALKRNVIIKCGVLRIQLYS